MKQILIKTKENQDYTITISNGIIDKISEIVDFSKYSKIAILTDKNLVKSGWLSKLENGFKSSTDKEISIIKIKAGEKHKNIKTVEKIWKQMLEAGLDRKSLLINLGGGVVCDMGGLCASTYMRGIAFMQIPTTLLSQVDASVGGKTGFDFCDVKNCIGAFTHPKAVIIDTDTLSTLPNREFISGFGEVLKYGMIYDKEFFDYLKNLEVRTFTDLSKDNLSRIIKVSCEIKAKVVEEDFKEGSIRKILNYGHTLGHAIESLSLKSRKALLHGEAVAIGMLGEAYIAKKLGRITETEFTEIKEIIRNYNLPTKYKTNKKEQIYNLLFKDKKTVGKKINWVLMNKIGSVDFDVKVSEDIVKEAIEYITE